MRVDLTHCAAQTEAFEAFGPGKRVCAAWGRGVGKSWFVRILIYLLVAEWDSKVRTNEATGATYPGVRIALVYPTMAQFKRIGQAGALKRELAPKGEWGFLGADINLTEWTITFPGGSTIQVVSAENAEAYRGLRRDVIFVDEADDVDISPFESIFVPWFTEPVSLRQVWISGTPKRGRFGLLWRAFHVWPHGDAEHAPMPGASSTHATGYDCPGIVSKELLDEERRHIPADRFDREYLCNFDSGEGLVYPFFDVRFHVRRPPAEAEFHTYLVGVDYGFADPTVFVVIGVAGSGRDAICHVVHEVYVTGRSDSELVAIAARIDQSYPDAFWYADHRPQTTKQIREEAGVRIVEANKGPGSVENGVAYVADALFIREREAPPGQAEGYRWAQLYVDPSCQHTIEEFGVYRRKRDTRDKERVLDVIDSSGNDHCMDAIRYALFSHFVGLVKRLEKSVRQHSANA